MKKLLNLGQALSRTEQKEIHGGERPGGPCTEDSNIVCTFVGNDACPANEGCYIQDADEFLALCKCL